MRQIAAHRAAIADRSVGDMLVGRDDERRVLPDDRRGQHVGVPRQSADHKPIALDRNPAELGNTIDVDQPLRCDQPQVHHRNQALAAGQNFRLVAVLSQRGENAVQIDRANVLEGWRFHDPSLAVLRRSIAVSAFRRGD